MGNRKPHLSFAGMIFDTDLGVFILRS
jgi:hypothetical protein